MKLIGPINSGAAVGGDGVATANTDHTAVVVGLLLGVYIKYNLTPPAGTTDVVIATAGAGAAPPANTILTITNSATDAWYYPRHVTHDETGAVISRDGTRDVHEPVAIHDFVNVNIAQANALDNVDVWLLLAD